jgi:hypothetical protein
LPVSCAIFVKERLHHPCDAVGSGSPQRPGLEPKWHGRGLHQEILDVAGWKFSSVESALVNKGLAFAVCDEVILPRNEFAAAINRSLAELKWYNSPAWYRPDCISST